VAKRVRSDLLRANAWHHRSDAISSVIVFAGIAGTMAGMPYLDAVGAIGVSLMIGKIGWDLGWGAIKELVDSGVEPERLQEIQETIKSVDGVRDCHMLRTRRMGGEVLVEAHVLVEPQVTVSEGHMICDRIRQILKADHAEIGDVLVHIDPEDDAVNRPSSGLPDRDALLKELDGCWDSVDAARRIANDMSDQAGQRQHVGKVSVYFH